MLLLQPNKRLLNEELPNQRLEIFITLTKYNTFQRREEGNRC